MRYQVDFLLPLKLQKIPYYFGLCRKILLANQFAGFFTCDLCYLLILIPGVHCYIVLVLFVNLFKPNFPFHIETGNFICNANQMTDFYMKCDTGLKWVKEIYINNNMQNTKKIVLRRFANVNAICMEFLSNTYI